MNIKIKWSVVVILMLTAVLISAFLLIDNKESIKRSEPILETELTAEQIRDQRLIVEAQKALEEAKERGNAADERSAMRKLAESLGGKASAMFGLSLDGMVDHTLHGVVLDQLDRPVGGATVYTLYGNSGFMQGYGDHRLTTDLEGRFVSRGSGGSVTVLNVVHPEITRFQRSYVANDGKVQHRLTVYLNSADNTPENPRVLRVWRVDSFANVVRFGGAGRSLYAPPTGEAKIENHLRLTCVRTPYTGRRAQPSTWTMKLETAEPGGFQSAEDAYPNLAPIDNYVLQAIEAGGEFGSEEFKKFHDFREVYYFKSGLTYGVFKLLEFSPFSKGDKCGVKFNMARYNNEGTRDLAVPSKYEDW